MLATSLFVSGANGTKACLDPESSEYSCVPGAKHWQTIHSNEPECNDLTDADLPDLKKCFDVIGRAGLTHIDISNHDDLTTLPDDLFEGMVALEDLAIILNDNLEELPVGLFKDNTNLVWLNLQGNALKALPLGLFDGLSKLKTLPLQYNMLTTLPAGLFTPLTSLENLYLHGYEHRLDMQCLPESTATNVRLATDSIADGTCGCTPEDAVSCPASTVCTPGTKGYTCETGSGSGPGSDSGPASDSESSCSNGLPGYDGVGRKGSVCCPLGCGGCGGKRCRTMGEEFGLGRKDCCIMRVMRKQPDCADSGSAPCVISSK